MGGVQVNGTSLTLGKAINYVYHAGRLGQTFCHTALCINACTCTMQNFFFPPQVNQNVCVSRRLFHIIPMTEKKEVSTVL